MGSSPGLGCQARLAWSWRDARTSTQGRGVRGRLRGRGLHTRPYLHTTLRGWARPPVTLDAISPTSAAPRPTGPVTSGMLYPHTQCLYLLFTDLKHLDQFLESREGGQEGRKTSILQTDEKGS